MEVKIKKLNDNAIIPTYGTEFSAGADLYACIDENLIIKSGETVMVKTGISLEIPEGLVGLVYARSGLAFKKGIAPSNKVGVIDSDYRGEIMVALHNHSKEDYVIEKFERIAQLVIAPYIKADFVVTETLNDTIRNQGGFGSTGKK
ncbi:dUTP diphosphatase [Streptobacillus ratti]|uniref:dUTP diphosphatase n=1 Tax=Streptobacillus ratti TaxID=1720557 RepID=UPI0009FAF71F|nr:dUTP diphosphatase [Streptobacillus ratti]